MTTIIATAATVAANNDHWDGPGPWWPIFPFLWLLFIIGIFATFRFFGMRRWRQVQGYAGTRAGEASWPSATRPARSTSRSTSAGSPPSSGWGRHDPVRPGAGDPRPDQEVRPARRGGRGQPDRPPRGGVRVPRSQRSRQDHDPADAARSHPPDERRGCRPRRASGDPNALRASVPSSRVPASTPTSPVAPTSDHGPVCRGAGFQRRPRSRGRRSRRPCR